MLSTIVTILHIGSSDFIHLITQFVLLYKTLFPSSPSNRFLLCFYQLKVFCFLMIPQINDTMQCLSFSIWLISLSIMPSRVNYVPTSKKMSFFLKAEYYSIVHIQPTFLVHHPLMKISGLPKLFSTYVI